jgi:hypothetical protein
VEAKDSTIPQTSFAHVSPVFMDPTANIDTVRSVNHGSARLNTVTYEKHQTRPVLIWDIATRSPGIVCAEMATKEEHVSGSHAQQLGLYYPMRS